MSIPPGAHVAIIGESGAGKSTLVGLLLGWHQPASGTLTVDGAPLQGEAIDRVRADTAWVDPAVQIWNRSLIENLEYGSDEIKLSVGRRIVEADLRNLVEHLPEGLQTPLGEGGTLVSGGEGQRVRFGRGLGRPDARLAILDEPFRGLERDRRAILLRKSRERWRRATLVCVTHDIAETGGFDRVIVIGHGRVLEDGKPGELAARPDSRYRALLDAEAAVGQRLWAHPSWRTIRIDQGRIEAGPSPDVPGREDDRTRQRQVTV